LKSTESTTPGVKMAWIVVFSTLIGCGLYGLVFVSSIQLASSVVNCTGSISQDSYEAIESLYNSTAGWNWVWDPEQPLSTIWQFPSSLDIPCSYGWQGLVCTEDLQGGACDIEAILLSHYNLAGSIPPQLGNLLSLEELELQFNSLDSSIPSELGSLVHLELLELQFNSLDGSIPSELGSLVNMSVLDLNFNSLEGSIPSELGSLVNLVALGLHSNSMTGSVPSQLGNLVNSFVLELNDNLLDDAIPTEIGNLVHLEVLELQFNLFSGSIPSELGNLVNLETLELYEDSLHGSIPSELGNLVNLKALYLYRNSLVGSIPSEIGRLVNLQACILFGNALNGSMPSELGSLVNLGALELQFNSLEGSIPSELGNLVNLEALELQFNSIDGSVPSELGKLGKLEALQLQFNSLGGSIPSELGNLVNLEGLQLHANCLHGRIPSAMGKLVNLAVLELEVNALSGSVPSELGNLVTLEAIELYDNSLVGTLPLSFSRLSLLQSANLSTNMLSGAVDVFASSNFTSLQVLDLSSNRFSGTIPASIFALPVLQSVILSQNCFSGSLPSSMCLSNKLSNIVMDVLTGNCGSKYGDVFQGKVLKHYMTGTIPACIWNSSTIRTLHLLGNGLEGPLMDIADTSVLSVLALGSNQLTGAIPVSLQQHSFTQLDLSINRLSGTLSSDLSISPHTTVYDLSVNRLSGNIPTALYSSYSTGVVNVLEGNVFSCQQNKIPPSDVGRNSYQCGSVDFQYSLIAWAAGFVLCAVAIIVLAIRCHWAIQITRVCKSRNFVSIIVGPTCGLGVCLVGMIGFVSLKMSSDRASTYSVQYWWTSTVTFAHNWIICIFLFLCLVAICAVFTMTSMSLSRRTDENIGTSFRVTPLAPSIVAHLANVIVVTTVNGVYVFTTIGRVNDAALLAIQAVLGIFKLAWSSWMIPWLLSRAGMIGANQVSHWVFMILFVFLGAPFASSFCESSSCFLYVLTKPAPISFSLISPIIYFTSLCDGVGCKFFSVSGEQLAFSSIAAPWIYSYQCSSAVITGYAPVLVLSYLTSGIIVPCLFLLVSVFPSRFPGLVSKTSAVLEFAYFENASAALSLDKKAVLALGRRTMVKYILNLGVMMTFGLAVPLLAIAIMWDTAFNVSTILLVLERFIGSCEQSGLEAEKFRQEFWSSFWLSKREVVGCVHIVLGYVSIFWSLFAFDWIADVYGLVSGGLTVLVPLLVPTLIGNFLLRRHRIARQMEVSPQSDDNIELAEIRNPVVVPQSTNDEFYPASAR
jgi:Leucine-rich repeat (LRR) protein